MKAVNIVVGRFQPITNGHIACVDEAYKKLGIDTVLVMINTPDDKLDIKHPFPTSTLLPIYQSLIKGTHIIDIVTVKNADIVKISEELSKKDYQIASWACGTDRVNDYKRMSTNYKEKANLADDFELIEVKRGDGDISATKVRQALIDNDYKTFCALTPFGDLKYHLNRKGEDIYKTLQAYVEIVEGYNEENEPITESILMGAAATVGASLLTYLIYPFLQDVARRVVNKFSELFGKKMDAALTKFNSLDISEEDRDLVLASIARKYAKTLPKQDCEQINQALDIVVASMFDEKGGMIRDARKRIKRIEEILPANLSYSDWKHNIEEMLDKVGSAKAMLIIKREVERTTTGNGQAYVKQEHEIAHRVNRLAIERDTIITNNEKELAKLEAEAKYAEGAKKEYLDERIAEITAYINALKTNIYTEEIPSIYGDKKGIKTYM